MKGVLKTSEFWMTLIGIAAELGKSMGLVPADLVDKSIIPIGVYVVGRLTSKAAKGTLKP